MQKLKMFLRLTIKSFTERKSRVAIAFFAIIVGTGVIIALFSVYYDINMKMSKELRAYGANLVLTPAATGATANKNAKEIEVDKFNKVVSKFSQEELVGYKPNLYGVAEISIERLEDVVSTSTDVVSGATSTGITRPVVLVGTWFDQVHKVNPYWHISGELPPKRDGA